MYLLLTSLTAQDIASLIQAAASFITVCVTLYTVIRVNTTGSKIKNKDNGNQLPPAKSGGNQLPPLEGGTNV